MSHDDIERQPSSDLEQRRRLAEEAIRKLRSLPVVGPLLTDDDLYDDDGLSRRLGPETADGSSERKCD